MNRPSNDNGEAEGPSRPPEQDADARLGVRLPLGDSAPAVNRRRFLEATGFSLTLAAMSGCGRAPFVDALPFAEQPEGVIPGRSLSYASTCGGCSAGCGTLVTVRDGRPLKMEGMPGHPVSRGGLCAIGQAAPLELYDNQRLQQPLIGGEPEEDWEEVDKPLLKKLDSVASSGGKVRFVTPTVTSPTLQELLNKFLGRYSDARHIVFDVDSCSAILDAHATTHGKRVLPRYRFEKASVIVSFGADFLGTWISPVEFTAGWIQGRTPTEEHRSMSYHAHFEGRVSLTGTKADRRYRLAEDEYGVVLSRLATELASHTPGRQSPQGESGASPLSHSISDAVTDIAERLLAAKGHGLVLCDSQDQNVQLLVNYINDLLGNYGATLDVDQPSRQRQGNDAQVSELLEEIETGKVGALFVAGLDLTQNVPDRDALKESIRKIPLVVSFSARIDDFASTCHFVCPDHHPLESWMDFEPIQGTLTLSQPMISPLGKTRSILESLARWSGASENVSAYELLQARWNEDVLRQAMKPREFQEFWDHAVHDGFVALKPAKDASAKEFDGSAIKSVAVQEHGEFSLQLYHKIALSDSRHAQNPWLQELPDPITKVTWDNYICISSKAATDLDLADGDLARVEADEGGASIELPVLIQRGQHDRVVSIALAYGVAGTERFTNIGPDWIEAVPTVKENERVGKNAAGMLKTGGASPLARFRGSVKLTKTNGNRPLAKTQQYESLEMPVDIAPPGAKKRDIVQSTTLAAFKHDPHAGAPHAHDFGDKQLWPEDHPKNAHWWGMTVDLNRCTGCSACLIACQSENNVPVVGKDEVRREREMHWIRIDRYYEGDDDDMRTSHQPMMCQHCSNAPCETVCPVLATVHGEEGLNEQAYNRCVGTRYCANNCPYKVRRFNWFNYPHTDELQNLVLNPDVTVRTRGVMEKCSMCVQRIEEGKMEARRRGLDVVDGDIQTACQQSCPAQAIVFGDMTDAASELQKKQHDPRHYRVLEELNVRPSVGYLRVVKNRDADAAEGGHHD